MDMGQPSNERAQLDALISAAAPDPLPAGQALPLLQQSGEKDAAVLGRLAYRALTGVDPGDGDPLPPGEVAPGFPPFAAEVLMRAICGPDHRRPTAQALLIVLDTVPLASWPGADRPFVTLGEPEATAAADVAPATVETPVSEPEPAVEPAIEPEVEPEVEPAVEVDEEVEELAPEPAVAAIHHDEFRSLLTPSRAVPRFDPLNDPLTDPLTDPWDPDTGEIARIDLALVTGTTATEPVAEETVAEDAVAEEPVLEADVLEPEPDAELVEPEPDAEVVAEEPDEAVDEQVDQPAAAAGPRGMHDEFRNFVSPSFAVPHFEPLEGTLPAGSDRVRRRRTRESSRDAQPESTGKPEKPEKPEKPAKAPKEPKPPKVRAERKPVANASSDDDRRQTLLLVGVILVLIVLGVLWATQSGGEDADGAGTPQGASRLVSQPVDVLP